MTRPAFARGVFEDCTVRDMPPNTYWMKDEQDGWLIRQTGTGKLIAANKSLRKAIDAAIAHFEELP
jgi:hypothetical protein